MVTWRRFAMIDRRSARCLRPWPLRLLLLSGLLPLLPAQNPDAEQFFESKIRPILANNCYACHTGARSGGLRLDSREAIIQGGKSGPAMVAGKPESSLLIQATNHSHPKL